MKRPIIWISLVCAALALFALWQSHLRASTATVTVAAARVAPLEVDWSAIGYVEARTANVSAPQVGRIVSISVREGDRVRSGQVLARLASQPEKAAARKEQAGLRSAAAQAAAARATLRETEGTQRDRIREADAQVWAAAEREQQAQAALAQRRKVVPAQLTAAQAQAAAARAELRDLQAGARPEETAQADAAVEAAQATLDRTRLDDQRQELLYQEDATSRQTRDAAREALIRARSALQQAQAARALLSAGSRPNQIAAAAARLAAAEAQVGVAEGDLAGLRVAEHQVTESVAARRAAEATRAEARSALAHLATLRNDFDAARANTAQSAAGLQQARAVLAERTLRAPFGGFIGRRFVDQGDLASPTQPLFAVVEADRSWVEAEVDEQDLAPVRQGKPVTVTAPGYADRTFAGVVESIGAEAIPQTEVRTGARIVRVRISLAPTPPAERALLKPGMQVNVQGSTVLASAVVLAPNDALLTAPHGSYVFVLDKDRVHRRSVRAGYVTDRDTEILSGLMAGNRVVVSGKEGLQEGARVTVRNAP